MSSLEYYIVQTNEWENLVKAIVRARLISLIHFNILFLSALWATTTFLAGGRYFAVALKPFFFL